MDNRLEDLYALPDGEQDQDISLLLMTEQCADMEERVRAVLEQLPSGDREIVECYMEMRDELEFQNVKTALRAGKRLAGGSTRSY